MLFQASEYDFAAAPFFDVVVVGAGAVGIPLAVRLARAGLRVSLIEAGPDGPDQKSQSFFARARAIGRSLPGLHLGRFRNLGGTTAFWGGQLVPFDPVVFEHRPWVAPADWPISAAEVSPWFDEAFAIIGMGDVMRQDAEVWSALGITPPPATGGIEPFFTRWAREPNFTIAFREDLRGLAQLDVITGAQVGGLRMAQPMQIDAVELHMPDGTKPVLRGSQIVLANGTIEISRLLLLAAKANSSVPWANNPWIGRGFMDHADTWAGTIEPIDHKRFGQVFDNAVLRGVKYAPKLRLSAQTQKSEALLEISSHFVYSSSISENLANLKILVKGLLRGRLRGGALNNPLALLKTLRFVGPMALRYLRYRRVMNVADRGIQLRMTAEQRPMHESRITLSGRVDPLGLAEVDVDWRIAPEDIETMVRFALLLKDYLQDQGLAKVTLSEELLARDPAYLAGADDANHHMGGARMAESPEEGVVDRDCKVFGTDNLHVAGQAVYPTSGFANPTFTAIALGQRLAEHLIIRHRAEAGDIGGHYAATA